MILPRYDTSIFTPVFKPVYEFDFNSPNLEYLNGQVFGHKFKGNNLKIAINLQENFNIEELIDSLNDISKIDIKLYNKKGEMFKIIENRISFGVFDYGIRGRYNYYAPHHLEVEFKNINTTFIEI